MTWSVYKLKASWFSKYVDLIPDIGMQLVFHRYNKHPAFKMIKTIETQLPEMRVSSLWFI